MEARLVRAAFLAALLSSLGAGYRTPNFVVNAPTAEIAQQVGKLAEQYRRELALQWLGRPLENWPQPCPITVEAGPRLGAGGATSFVFDRGQVFGWQMTIQGPLDRLLDSVLPHEVTHTIFASHFRQPLPRWADEGACSTVEHRSERHKQQKMLVRFLQTGRGIAFDDMFRMKEYPRDILPLYAQGHSLATFLVAQGGKRKFVRFVGEGLQTHQWRRALKQHYRFADLGTLQNAWLDWVKQGSPLPLKSKADESFVSTASRRSPAADGKAPRPEPNLIHQVADAGGFNGQLVPVRRSDDEPSTIELASNDGAYLPGSVRGAPGWRRRGEPTPAPDSSLELHDQAPRDDAPKATAEAVTSQVTRPQSPQPVKQMIVEWSQAPRTAPRVSPSAVAAQASGVDSIYAGRTSAPLRR